MLLKTSYSQPCCITQYTTPHSIVCRYIVHVVTQNTQLTCFGVWAGLIHFYKKIGLGVFFFLLYFYLFFIISQDKTKFNRKGFDMSSLLVFCFKKGVPLETVKVLLNEISILKNSTLHEQEQVLRNHNCLVANYKYFTF